MTFADKGYQGAGGSVRTPFKRPPAPAETVSPAEGGQPGPRPDPRRGERAVATLKTWKVLAKLRCCPRRATTIVQAILVLHHVEDHRTQDENGSLFHSR